MSRHVFANTLKKHICKKSLLYTYVYTKPILWDRSAKITSCLKVFYASFSNLHIGSTYILDLKCFEFFSLGETFSAKAMEKCPETMYLKTFGTQWHTLLRIFWSRFKKM